MDTAQAAMKNIKLPEKTQIQIQKYLGFSQRFLDSQNELERFMDMISPGLRIEVIKHIFSKVLQKNEVFRVDKVLIRFVTDNLETQIHLPDKFVIRIGEEPNGMYFISSGILDVKVKDEFKNEVICNELSQGSYFGEVAVINKCH